MTTTQINPFQDLIEDLDAVPPLHLEELEGEDAQQTPSTSPSFPLAIALAAAAVGALAGAGLMWLVMI